MTRFEKAAQVVANKCLDIKKEESILILVTEPFLEIAGYLQKACARKTKHTFTLNLSHLSSSGTIHASIAALMKKMNVIIALTSPSISHTDARRQACRAGARIVSMPNITLSTFSRIAGSHFERIGRRSRKLADVLSMAKEAKVTAPNGTELILPISKRKGYADIGILDKPGSFTNLPAGEAAIAPDDLKTEGELVVDSGMGINQKDQDLIRITIKGGRAVRISGSPAARKLSQHLSKFGPDSRLVAEFGMGTNDNAQISGYSLEDEKVLGTIHIAIGNNVSFGGTNTVPIHLDGVVYKPTVVIDGRKIIHNGSLVLE